MSAIELENATKDSQNEKNEAFWEPERAWGAEVSRCLLYLLEHIRLDSLLD